jgi:4-diphosphocytidyl-2-C-methyl-D-erythritol kinase
MIIKKSYTRLTLALDIIRKIKKGKYKGFHKLNIIKHQINLHDTISIETSDRMIVKCNNPEVPLDMNNLCWQAAVQLKKQFAITDNVQINIKKNIPIKGGLAGGSANAATVLDMLNSLWQLELDIKQLCNLGRKIGMDVPFYFFGKTAFDTESTEVIKPVDTNVTFNFVLATPDFGVSTKEAYQKISYNKIGQNTEKTARMKFALQENDREQVIKNMHNDFELSVFKRYPALSQVKKELLKAGCLNVVMSGSGSTLVGIAKDQEHAQQVKKRFPMECVIAATYHGD